MVALTVFLTAFQGPAIDLARDLTVFREIDDRLLAPLPIALVAIEKILLAVLRALISGAFIFPLAYWILGNGFQMRLGYEQTVSWKQRPIIEKGERVLVLENPMAIRFGQKDLAEHTTLFQLLAWCHSE